MGDVLFVKKSFGDFPPDTPSEKIEGKTTLSLYLSSAKVPASYNAT